MDTMSDIRIFVEVVRGGSFASASRTLGQTPSGISRTIARLEEDLGVRLLNRTTRKMTLTEAGRILFERGERLMEDLQDTETLVREHSDTPRGRLRVAATDAFTILVLVPFLKEFLDRHPHLSVTTTHGDGEVDLLGEGVDVAIRFEQPSAQSFIARKISDDPYMVVASPEYLERYGTPQTPLDLPRHRCLNVHARRRTTSRWAYYRDGQEEFVQVEGIFSGIGLAVHEAVLAGLGVARLASYVVRPEIESGALVPILTDWEWTRERAIWAVYPHRDHLPSKVRVFVDELSEFARKGAPRLAKR